ncbi:hypothetical protein N7448_002665, partial [Penicillium atrosanguineum]
KSIVPWLPIYLCRLYDLLKRNESTWGFTIFRTTYTPQSDVVLTEIGAFHETYEDLLQGSRANQVDKAVFDELWAKYEPCIIDDSEQFNGASLRQHPVSF